MFTSNFVRALKLTAGLRPVSIARKAPYWYRGDCELRLAPTLEMLQMSLADYVPAFDELLCKLDPAELFESLGANAVILCWESPGVFCHRRRVAQWFESELGVIVPEFGFDRAAYPAYPHMAEKGSVEAKRLPRILIKADHTA
jgi:hypothetical protein